VRSQEGNVEELGRSLELFNRVFGLRSPRQIQAFVERYDTRAREAQNRSENELASGGRTESRTVRNFEWTIRKSVNIHSDIKQAILLYARISKNMQLYFAEKLHEAVSQARPDHQTIIRVAVSRSEIDLYDICNEYRRKYGHHLMFDLQNMCSGDFLRLLSRLVS
uniref:Annexin n=1 Tax=Globodera pallida TaxID=36090 RepID=A0A183CTA7_GLOPA